MNSIIEALYFGEIDPSMHPGFSPESAELHKEFSAIRNRFKSLIHPDLHDEFDYLNNKSVELSVHDGKTAFHTGFLLGAQLMLEVLQTDI